FLIRRIKLMTMTFVPESVRFASESFSVVSAVIIAVLAAIVMTGFWEFLFQEIKLKRHERQSTMRRFDRAVERLQNNRMGNNPIVDRVTQGLVSDLPRIRSARSSARETYRAAKICRYCSTARVPKGNSASKTASVAVVSVPTAKNFPSDFL